MTKRRVMVMQEICSCHDCPHFWLNPQINGAPYCTELGEMLNIPTRVQGNHTVGTQIKPAIPDKCPLPETFPYERRSGAAS